MSTYLRREFRGSIESLDDAKAALDRLFDMQNRILEMIELGPLPGAYFPLTFLDTGAVSVGNGRDGVLINFDCRPIYMSAWLGNRDASNHCVVDLNDDGTSILTAALDLNPTGGEEKYFKRSDFASDLIEAGSKVTMDVDSITGAPSRLRALLVLKNLGRLEPALNSKTWNDL